MQFPDHMLAVRASVDAGRGAEFNRWYDTEHLPDALRLFPGVIGAARYKVGIGDGSHHYIALYAFESAEQLQAALEGPGLKTLIKKYDAAVGSFSTRGRTTYAKIFELATGAEKAS